jgi:hypothetical protein
VASHPSPFSLQGVGTIAATPLMSSFVSTVISFLVKSPYSKAEKKSIEWRRRADDSLFSSGLESGLIFTGGLHK